MSKWKNQQDQIISYYNDLIKEHGHDPRSCDYGRAQSQSIKFKVIAESMPLSGKKILDVGCGFADFADYLANSHKDVVYHGVDINPTMIKEAQRLHPELSLKVLDILEDQISETFDLVTANGIFYLMGKDAESLMHQLIKKMFDLSTHAVAFTTLSTWAPFLEKNEFYADPAKTLDYCRTLTPRVTLRHDYMDHDFTVYLYKSSPRS